MKERMLLQRVCYVVVILLTTLSCDHHRNNDKFSTHPLLSKVEDYLEWEGQNGFSGTVAVQYKNEPVLIKSFGYADEANLVPNGPDIIYDIGSLSKQFTSAAILKLEMLGKLSVSDSLAKFFPDLPQDKGDITVHQLLTHTSGLPGRAGRSSDPVNGEQLIEKLIRAPLLSNPGDSVIFSDFGYNVLGLIIEKASETSYEQFLRDHLFNEAGLKNTGYVLPDWNREKIAHGYSNCRDWGKPTDLNWSDEGPYWNLKGAGGLLSTPSDLLAWIPALESNAILDDLSRNKLFTPYVKQGQRQRGSFGYGWKIFTSSRNTTVHAHDGFNGRFFIDCLRYSEDDVTILVLSNRVRFGNPSLTYEIASCIFTPDYRPVVRGKLTQCLDSLPDNRIGAVTGKLLETLENQDSLKTEAFFSNYISSYLANKHPKEKIMGFLKHDLAPRVKNTVIEQVTITDFKIIDLILKVPGKEDRLFINVILDENEDYKIRGIGFDDKPFRTQG